MNSPIRRLSTVLVPGALIAGYIAVMGSTGRCMACEAIVNSTVALTGYSADPEPEASPDETEQDGSEQQSGPDVASQEEPDFKRVQRPGSVDIDTVYDLSNASIPTAEIHTLLPRDAIPALTDPKTQPAGEADWLPDRARVIVVTVGEGEAVETLGVPLVILNWHEIVNTTVGGVPVAVTYCPLCDSATVFSRVLKGEDGTARTLEFGVSGALYNSNVLMYDRQGMGLWSQLAMEAVTGADAGAVLEMLPIRLMPFGAFRAEHPGARIVSSETGHERSYDWEKRPYRDFFSHDRTLVPVRAIGDELPKKTLGVGIAHGGSSWFVPVDRLDAGPVTVETPAGSVVVQRTEAGVFVGDAPPGVRTVQAFYYAWSAFYPETAVLKEDG